MSEITDKDIKNLILLATRVNRVLLDMSIKKTIEAGKDIEHVSPIYQLLALRYSSLQTGRVWFLIEDLNTKNAKDVSKELESKIEGNKLDIV